MNALLCLQCNKHSPNVPLSFTMIAIHTVYYAVVYLIHPLNVSHVWKGLLQIKLQSEPAPMEMGEFGGVCLLVI